MKKQFIVLFLSVIFCFHTIAQECTIQETKMELITYPFSNPDPVAEFGTIYPYFRFNGYSARGEKKVWKMVEMENPYVKLWITPDIGGKIWGAVEKSTGKEFIYFNHAVKFRDIAMRGPWTSGGMEINFGVIGHAPTVSTPVDYFIRVNADSSVSCFLGALDLPSRTEWRVEVLLPKDKAGFYTKVLWFNGSPLEQSYYQWMNVGVKTRGHLEYSYPGKYYIGHDGDDHLFPVDEQGRQLSFYEKNNFGPAKSYHVIGTYTDFFGGYWHEDEFGFGHYSNYGDKPGKKIWIWGLSRNGMIWENLLTDTDGQYTEIQSGRLFNQAGEASSQTPFKHRSFNPYQGDIWSEYWFPVKGTRGITYGTDQIVFDINKEGEETILYLFSTASIDNQLKLFDDNKLILDIRLLMEPGEVKQVKIPVGTTAGNLKLLLGEEEIYSPEVHDHKLNRPVKMPEDFNEKSVFGLYTEGKELERQRYFDDAKERYALCLALEPYYLPALSSLAGIKIREMEYGEALILLKKALSVDTYDPASNFYYGLANQYLGNRADALDGFSMATSSAEYRVAALTQLAMCHLREKSLDKAGEYARVALTYNQHNLTAHQLMILTARLRGDTDKAENLAGRLLASDPLNHFARFEKYLLSSKPEDAEEFRKYIRNELAYETYLELAIQYYNLNRYDDAIRLLEMAPGQTMVRIWKAFLLERNTQPEEALAVLAEAEKLSPGLVFPFRQEDVQALRWAAGINNSWKLKYYLSLALANLSHREEALEWLNGCGDVPDYFPFYSTRAGLSEDETLREKDLVKAQQLTGDWRPLLALARFYGEKGNWAGANALVEPYQNKHPENYYTGLYLARCFLNLGRYANGIQLLSNLLVLPNEGASEGRNTWREMHLRCALEEIKNKKYERAVKLLESARLWPENLGVGRPYEVDERMEDFLSAVCQDRSGKPGMAQKYFQKVIDPVRVEGYKPSGVSDLLSALALEKTGSSGEGKRLLLQWTEESPAHPVAAWGLAQYSGNTAEAERILSVLRSAGDKPGLSMTDDKEFQLVINNRDLFFGE